VDIIYYLYIYALLRNLPSDKIESILNNDINKEEYKTLMINNINNLLNNLQKNEQIFKLIMQYKNNKYKLQLLLKLAKFLISDETMKEVIKNNINEELKTIGVDMTIDALNTNGDWRNI
jgi:hypothetical protein